MTEPAVLIPLCALTAFAGVIGGVGGATLLVPSLLALGLTPLQAAPLGLMSVAATSLAASVRQLDDGLVHHRLGLTVEVPASMGAVVGALVSTSVPEDWLARVLGLGALAGAMATLSRKGVRNLPRSSFVDDSPGEWPGTLGGTYHHGGHSVPYLARRIKRGMAVALVAGSISGMAGVGGGFLKTPAMSEVMRVPVKVASATATFTMGVTAAAGLIVFSGQGRLEPADSAAVVLGALGGALAGAAVQSSLPAARAKTITGVLLGSIGILVLVRSL